MGGGIMIENSYKSAVSLVAIEKPTDGYEFKKHIGLLASGGTLSGSEVEFFNGPTIDVGEYVDYLEMKVIITDDSADPEEYKVQIKTSSGGSFADLVTGMQCSTSQTAIGFGILVAFSAETGYTNGEYASCRIYQHPVDRPTDEIETHLMAFTPINHPPQNVETDFEKSSGKEMPTEVQKFGFSTQFAPSLLHPTYKDLAKFTYYALGKCTSTQLSGAAYRHVIMLDTEKDEIPYFHVMNRLGKFKQAYDNYGMVVNQFNFSCLPETPGSRPGLSFDMPGCGLFQKAIDWIALSVDSETDIEVVLQVPGSSYNVFYTTPGDGEECLGSVQKIRATGDASDIVYITPISATDTTINIPHPDILGTYTSTSWTYEGLYRTISPGVTRWEDVLEDAVDVGSHEIRNGHLIEARINPQFAYNAGVYSATGGLSFANCGLIGFDLAHGNNVAWRNCAVGGKEYHDRALRNTPTTTVTFNRYLKDMIFETFAHDLTVFGFYAKFESDTLIASTYKYTFEIFIPKMQVADPAIADQGGWLTASISPTVLEFTDSDTDPTNVIFQIQCEAITA
jgi:hypothetical protein